MHINVQKTVIKTYASLMSVIFTKNSDEKVFQFYLNCYRKIKVKYLKCKSKPWEKGTA